MPARQHGNGGRSVRRARVFPSAAKLHSYYNDRFDLHDGVWSTSAASFPANADRWSQWTTISAFRPADYERVDRRGEHGRARHVLRGVRHACSRLSRARCRHAQVRSWFSAEADGEYAVGHGPGPVAARSSSCPSRPASPKKATHTGYMENRVIYLFVDGTAGHAIVSGTVRMRSHSPMPTAPSARSPAAAEKRACASAAPLCCCSCVKRWRRFTSTGRMPLPRTDISPLWVRAFSFFTTKQQ